MKDGPNIAAIAALLGDPARANMLTALMHGQAMTATELAQEAGVLEGLMGVAARTGHLRVRTGPRDPELRRARVCYDHLAGDAAVRMFDRLQAAGMIAGTGATLRVTKAGERFFSASGIDLDAAAN